MLVSCQPSDLAADPWPPRLDMHSGTCRWKSLPESDIFLTNFLRGLVSVAERRFFEFGPFRLDPNGRVLFRGHQPRPLPPKAADTLLLLVENAGAVVEKEDLLKKVWPDAIVEEGSLTRTIFVLRKALEDGGEGEEYVTTIPKRGYRFSFPVRVVEGDAPAVESNAATQDTRRHRTRRIAVVLASIALALAILSYFSARWYFSRPGGHAGMRMIAILPFQNLTGDPAQEFVADGLTEEMITQLGGLNHEQLGVIARTSAMTYKGTSKPVSQIGDELGVNYLLEGSVRRWGERIRISTQLIRTRDQTQIWAKTYESDVEDVVKVQSDVAQAVAREISLTLAPDPRNRVTSTRVDRLVYELCLRGRYEWNKRTESAIKQAIYYFQQAISRDPSYAPAYAGLADAYAVLPYYSKGTWNDIVATVKALAEHALQLDESLAEAHTTLGLVECSYLDTAAAERQYQRALELNPNYATAHHWHSFCLWLMNRQDESLAEFERARQLDPLSLIIYSDEAKALISLHQSDRAIRLLGTAIELDPNFADAHPALALAYLQTGLFSQAVSEARRGVELDPNDYEQATLGYVYGVAGHKEQARAILAALNQPGRPVAVYRLYLSLVYAGLGQKGQALRILEQACREGHPIGLGGPEPMLDPVRSDPRFQDLLRCDAKNITANGTAPKS